RVDIQPNNVGRFALKPTRRELAGFAFVILFVGAHGTGCVLSSVSTRFQPARNSPPLGGRGKMIARSNSADNTFTGQPVNPPFRPDLVFRAVGQIRRVPVGETRQPSSTDVRRQGLWDKPNFSGRVTTFSSGSPRTKRSMFRATSRERRSIVP